MKYKRKYEHAGSLEHTYAVKELVPYILKEIEKSFKLFDSIESEKDPRLYDDFNKIRIITPILETASRIEFQNEKKDGVILLLEKLGVPEPEICFYMFRHGLAHFVRPYQIEVDGIRKKWAISFTEGHLNEVDFLSIDARKLLRDLNNYLMRFSNNQNKIKVVFGTKYNTKKSI